MNCADSEDSRQPEAHPSPAGEEEQVPDRGHGGSAHPAQPEGLLCSARGWQGHPALPWPALPCPALPCPALPFSACPTLPAAPFTPSYTQGWSMCILLFELMCTMCWTNGQRSFGAMDFITREASPLSSMMYTHYGLTCAVLPGPALPCLPRPVCPALHSQPAEAAGSAVGVIFPSQLSSYQKHEKQGIKGKRDQLCLTYRVNISCTKQMLWPCTFRKLVMTVYTWP